MFEGKHFYMQFLFNIPTVLAGSILPVQEPEKNIRKYMNHLYYIKPGDKINIFSLFCPLCSSVQISSTNSYPHFVMHFFRPADHDSILHTEILIIVRWSKKVSIYCHIWSSCILIVSNFESSIFISSNMVIVHKPCPFVVLRKKWL